jgi:NAD-specific glutamate dehydrogenase
MIEITHLALESLLLLLELLLLGGLSVVLEPAKGLLDGSLDGLAVAVAELALDLLVVDAVADVEGVVLEAVLGLDLGLVDLVVSLEALGLGHHPLDIVLAETTLVVGDGDAVLLAGGLLDGGDVEDTVGIDIEGNLDLRDTTGHGRDTIKVELAKKVVVLGHRTLTLENLDKHTGLVVAVGGENLSLLGGDGGVTLDDGGEDTTGSLKTKGQGGNVEEEELIELAASVSTRENGGLDGGTVGDGLIGVDGLAGLLPVEELLEELLDLGNTSGATDKDNLVDSLLGHLGVTKDLLDGQEGLLEVVHAELLETGTGDGDL